MIKTLSAFSFSLIAVVTLPARAGVPLAVNHQGAITVLGERFTGDGFFWFALVDPDTGQYLWTNDGTMLPNCTGANCTPPVDAVLLTVINGIYNVRLGGNGMASIDSSVFEMPNIALRIWFNDDQGNGTHQLSPDQLIASVPFAFRSATIDDDAVTSEKIASGAVGNTELAINAVTGSRIQDETVSASDLATDSVGSDEIMNGAVTNSKLGPNAVTTSKIAPLQVGNSQLADNAVNGAKIQDGTIGADDLDEDSVGSSEIINNSITSLDLAANSVSLSELGDNAVSNAKMRDNAVGSAEIINNSITSSDLASSFGSLSKVSGGKMRASFSGVVEVLDSQLILDVDATELTSGDDFNPEVYLATGQGCDAFHRGAMYVGRVSGAGAANQDCLCVCLLVDGTYQWACFNP